jgi:hypothetical protein
MRFSRKSITWSALPTLVPKGLAKLGLDHGIGHFTSMSLQKTQRHDIAKG